ncbi:unnamed protein product [Umbelopsis ramanniana]
MAQQSLPYNRQLGLPKSNVPWRAGHAAVYLPPYVIVYGGVKDPLANNSGILTGSDDVWAWNVNGSWYNPQPIVQSSSGTLLPQVLFQALNLPSQGQMLAIVSNTTGGSTIGTLQVLDTTSWSWTFPPPQVQPPTRTQGFSAVVVNNTVYSYGGSSVDVNGLIQSNSVQNSLSSMDANSFSWSNAPNGPALTEHASCYLPKCDCIVTFGGSSTGVANEVLSDINIYNLASSTWNLNYAVGSVGGASPGPRRLHTATCLTDKAIIYGGGTNQPVDNDVWILDASAWPTLTWLRQDTNKANGPSMRMGHSAVYDSSSKNIYFYGGWGPSATNDNNMYVLNSNNWTWSSVPSTGYPTATTSSSSAPSASSTGSTLPAPGDSSLNTTPIIAGSVVGGIVAIAAIILGFFLYRRHQTKKYIVTDKEVFVREGFPPGSFGDGSSKNLTEHGNGSFGMTEHTNSNNNLINSSNRHSTAWTLSTMNDSVGRIGTMSELGDRNSRILSGVLEMMPPIPHSDSEALSRDSNDSGRRSPFDRNSHHSNGFLQFQGPGQTPNEFDSYERQKPNEYSRVITSPHTNHSVSIDRRLSQPISVHEGAPLSSSMEVFRSSMNTTSDMVAPVMITHAIAKQTDKDDTISPHTANSQNVDDDEAWTFADSLSFNGDGPPPIRYIPPSGSSRHFSVATTSSSPSAALYASKHLSRSTIPLTHHQHSSVPVARPATPPSVSLPNLSTSSVPSTGGSDIYRAVSPLDMLATLGHVPDTSEVIIESPRDSMMPDSSRQSSSDALSTPESEVRTPSEATSGFIASLPGRYTADLERSTIEGPSNSVIFVQTTDNHTPRTIKWFGRREAWERECRTLMKLRSPYVVELVEVLTIQNQKNKTQPSEEENVQYATVMECLDETLGSVIRHARRNKRRAPGLHAIIKEITESLGWCHSRGIAFCDLKPSNVMHNRRNGHWKLIDFEASRTIGEELVGVITPRYCPPEVARATTYGLEGANGVVAAASIDMWALGCVIYELETNSPLFPNNITDSTILHFISHPSSTTPALNNGLRWNDESELEIPGLDSLIQDAHSRTLIRTLLSRDPAKRSDVASVLRSTYLRQAQQLPQRTPSQRGQRHTVDVVNNILPQTADIVTKDTLPTDGS